MAKQAKFANFRFQNRYRKGNLKIANEKKSFMLITFPKRALQNSDKSKSGTSKKARHHFYDLECASSFSEEKFFLETAFFGKRFFFGKRLFLENGFFWIQKKPFPKKAVSKKSRFQKNTVTHFARFAFQDFDKKLFIPEKGKTSRLISRKISK